VRADAAYGLGLALPVDDPASILALDDAIAMNVQPVRGAARLERTARLFWAHRSADAASSAFAALADHPDPDVVLDLEHLAWASLARLGPAAPDVARGAPGPVAIRAAALVDAARALEGEGALTWATADLDAADALIAVPASGEVRAAIAAHPADDAKAWAERVVRWCVDAWPPEADGAFELTLSSKGAVVSAASGGGGAIVRCLEDRPNPPAEAEIPGKVVGRVELHAR
jgi:hypothetical protein